MRTTNVQSDGRLAARALESLRWRAAARVAAVAAIAATTVGCGAPPADDELETTRQDLSAPSCAPALARDAVPRMHRALLDTIAYTEGTAGTCGQDGYNTGFAYHCFRSCSEHPERVWSAGGYASSAAGRYQFLTKTWRSLDKDSFGPADQDQGAMDLVERRGVKVPEGRAMTSTEFVNALKKLSYEWASLPYSPYGQPRRSLAQTRGKYCDLAGC